MHKKVFLCGLIFSSCMFGMEKAEQLKLCCKITGHIEANFPVTFEEANQNNDFPTATFFDNLNAPGYFCVQLPKGADTYLLENKRTTTYVDTILNKEQTVSALQNLLDKNNKPSRIIMTVHSPHVPKQLSLLGQYYFVLETSELPALIKERYNITTPSKAEIQNY